MPKITDRRFFLCTGECVAYKDLYKHPNAHILGELRYLPDEGFRVTTLALYETPVSAVQVPPVNPSIYIYVIGEARFIKCRHAGCTRVQRWELGKAGFLALMARMGIQDKAVQLDEEKSADKKSSASGEKNDYA